MSALMFQLLCWLVAAVLCVAGPAEASALSAGAALDPSTNPSAAPRPSRGRPQRSEDGHLGGAGRAQAAGRARHGVGNPSLDQAVWFERGKVVYLADDGREIEFDVFDLPDHVLRPGQEVYEPINQLTLRFRRHDLIEIETHDGETREFSPPTFRGKAPRSGWWRLQRRRSRARHEIALTYDDRGNLQWVRDSGGRVIAFDHDDKNRLVRVRLPHPTQDGFIDYVRYFYDAEGDLVQVTDALGASWTWAYKRHLMVRETNRNGLSFYFAYDGWGSDAYCVRTWGDGGIYDHVIDYSKGVMTVVTNSLGYKTAYKLNVIGQVVEVVDARGGSTKYEYDERTLKLTKETAPDGGETKSEYDSRGNVLKITQPDGAEVQLEYERTELVRAVDPVGGEWRWAYDSVGRVIGRANPLGERTQFHWGEFGLIAVTDAAGQHTQIAYDSAGNLVSLVTADGTASSWSHDRLGRVLTSTDGNGNVRRQHRDALGRVVRTDELDGNTRELEYDGEGNFRRVLDRMYDVVFEYRGMNRLAARSQAGTRVEFLYDTEEQLTAIKNEHGFAYSFILGAGGDVAEEWGFDDLRRCYHHDLAGRVTLLLRPEGKTTAYSYDKAGRVTTVNYSDGTKEAYAYRPDGALLAAVNDSAELVFERDLLGRITQERFGENWVSSEYDALGQRRSVRSSKGLFERIGRNAMGDVLVVDAEVATARSPTSAETNGPISAFSARFERDRLGLELERSLPGGIRARWQRDSLGRPVRHEIWRGDQFQRAKQYTWEVNDRLKRVIDAMTGPIEYTHDAFGNLSAAAYGDGQVDLRMPDAVGNLFRTSDRSDRKYGPAGQLLEARDARGTSRYEYDAEGNLIRKTEADERVWTYHWNCAGMLEKVVRPDGDAVEFAYDALARRIAKKYRDKSTHWIWDGNVPLHEWIERDASFDAAAADADKVPAQTNSTAEIQAKARLAYLSAQPAQGPPASAKRAVTEGTKESPITWLFEPESFAPLAKVVDGERYGIVTDHLGTPTAMFDGAGSEVWGADISSYGELREVRGERGACPFRWPGQYEDEETGLYYNRFRYYDAWAGQYASCDPLGLEAGLGIYSYVSDPLFNVDLLGLEECGSSLKQALRKKLREVEKKALTAGDSGIRAALDRRELMKLGKAFVGEGHTVSRGRNGELWLTSADGKRLFRAPTAKSSEWARTGKQANFHERTNVRDGWFDSQKVSNVHVHSH